jgi:glycosyltransferase involved in cell wall biosynthesis
MWYFIPMKILTFNWHEGYIHLLSKTGYQFDVVQKLKGGIFGWIHEFRPVPSNCNLIAEDDARSRLNAGYYDRIICHNINDLLFAYESPIHKVLIFHNKLSCEIALGGNTINKEEYLRQVRGLLEAAKNRTLVFISKAKRDDWGLNGEIILPGIDIFEYGDWKGDVKKVLRVGNLLKERDIMLGYFIQERLLSDISFTILGLNPNISDSYLPKDWDEFKKHMRTHRVYLNTTLAPYEDGYNLAMLEAMATGMPVVSIANPTSPLEDGINGFISDDEDYLRERIIELLKDHYLAKSIGKKSEGNSHREVSYREVYW